VLTQGGILIQRAARTFARDEEGAGLVEYALILGLVAIGVIVALAYLGGGVGNVFDLVSDNLEAVATNQDPIEVGRQHGHGWCRHFGC
jgi:pilus assembly protein Flp/PilA